MADPIPLPVLAEIHSALDEPLARGCDRSQEIAIAADVAYRAGVAEGRRLTALDPATIRTHLDSEEFKLALRKMVRTGEIRVSVGAEEKPAYERGDDCPTCGASGDDRG